MTEQHRSKASELADDLRRRSSSPAERETPEVPEIKLRSDAPALEVTETTPIGDALAQLRSQGVGVIALREQGGEPTAVVIPAERYIELVGTELLNGRKVAQGGRLVPAESAFAAVYVEEVNPGDTWHRGDN
jgi:hypothetical protein